MAALPVALLLIGPSALAGASTDPADWPTFNHDAAGSRTSDERLLSPGTVRDLQVKWRFPVPGGAHGTPAVVGNTVYEGFGGIPGTVGLPGALYALSAQTGALRWRASANAAITDSPLVTANRVIFGDVDGSIYGVRRGSGAPAWGPLRPNPHFAATIQGSPMLVNDREAVIGVASLEEVVAGNNPFYPCCSFRGSVVAIDPQTGKVRWQTYLISPAQSSAGSSGAAVWSTPTYDPKLNLIFVSTGNNYSTPATGRSDAVVALDPTDGHVVWSNQLHADDVFNDRFPLGDPEHPDFDFADSPQVFRVSNGRPVVGAGQKSGVFHLLDARTGRLIDNLQLVPGGHFGGLFADSATAGGITYVNGSNWAPGADLGKGGVGHVAAIRSRNHNLKLRWDVKTQGSPNLGAVALANGVLYFLSSRAGDLYALDAKKGKTLAKLHLGTGISGPSVSHGRVFVGTGDPYRIVSSSPSSGSIFALGLPAPCDTGPRHESGAC